jgi:hypothetical protein
MCEKPQRRSFLRPMLTFLAIILMVAMFTGSILCMAFAYRRWNGSVVKVHRGIGVPQKRYTRLSDEDKNRIHALIAGAGGSAVVGLGLLAALRSHASSRG